MSTCSAPYHNADVTGIYCTAPEGHTGDHEAVSYIYWPADDPPEYDPDDAEAQRIAEACADANTEHDRIENEERQ